jgi:two-component system response regulator RegX3
VGWQTIARVPEGLTWRGDLEMDAKLLLVTDDLETGRVWTYAFGQRGAEVVQVGSAAAALSQWKTDVFDLVAVDVHTSELDGIDLCRQLRSEVVIPILLLLPEAREARVLEAYRAGVDECIVKPIGPALFVAKVRSWLTRSWTVPAGSLDVLQVGDLRLDPARREVFVADGSAVKLTNLEFRLLHLLMAHPGQVLEAGLIVDRVWGYPNVGDSVLLKNLVYRLRRKIEPEPGEPRYIDTVAGVGYAFQLM